MISATRLTKRYGSTLAVDELSFDVAPGKVTGFVGPNGAGKSTTLRLILGLDTPSSGRVTIDSQAYRALTRRVERGAERNHRPSAGRVELDLDQRECGIDACSQRHDRGHDDFVDFGREATTPAKTSKTTSRGS